MKRTLRTWMAIFEITTLATCLVGCGGGSESTSASAGTVEVGTTLIVPGAPTLLMATAGDASAARFSGNSWLCTKVMLNMMLPSDSMKWLAAWW